MCCNPKCLQDTQSSGWWTMLWQSCRNSNQTKYQYEEDEWCCWSKCNLVKESQVSVKLGIDATLTGTTLICQAFCFSKQQFIRAIISPTFNLHWVVTCVTWLSPIMRSNPPWFDPNWPARVMLDKLWWHRLNMLICIYLSKLLLLLNLQ